MGDFAGHASLIFNITDILLSAVPSCLTPCRTICLEVKEIKWVVHPQVSITSIASQAEHVMA